MKNVKVPRVGIWTALNILLQITEVFLYCIFAVLF
jgi:hypothetical protein